MDQNIRELACAILMQAVRDFADGDENQRHAIIKELRSPYMDLISNGMSVVVVEQLERHPEEITQRVRYMHN